MREETFEDFAFQYNCAVIPVLRVALDKWPSVDIADIGLALSPKQVKSTNILLKLLYDFRAQEFFLRCQYDRKPFFLTTLVSIDNPIQGRWPPGLCVHIIRSNGINFNVEGISLQELLINIISISPDTILIRLVLTADVLDLAEEHFPATTHILGIVNANVMILRVERFLYEGFLQLVHFLCTFWLHQQSVVHLLHIKIVVILHSLLVEST